MFTQAFEIILRVHLITAPGAYSIFTMTQVSATFICVRVCVHVCVCTCAHACVMHAHVDVIMHIFICIFSIVNIWTHLIAAIWGVSHFTYISHAHLPCEVL